MGQYQKIAGGVRSAVQHAPYRNLPRRFLHEWSDGCFSHPVLPVDLSGLARLDDLGWIDSLGIELHLHHFAVLVDDVIHPARGLVLGVVQAIFFSDVATPIAEQWKRNADFFCPRLVREGRIHAYTQDLGICSFQLGKILLEVLHLLGSTSGEGENVKRQRDILLALEVVQRNFVAVLIGHGEIRGHVADLDGWWWRIGWFFGRANGRHQHARKRDRGYQSIHETLLSVSS